MTTYLGRGGGELSGIKNMPGRGKIGGAIFCIVKVGRKEFVKFNLCDE